MDLDVSHFKLMEVLTVNEAEKTLYLLGNVEDKDGEAILILTPKVYNPQKLHITSIHTSFINDIYGRFTAELAS